MTFHQLIDSKTIPQTKNGVDINTFTGTINDDGENKSLNIDLIDITDENIPSSPISGNFPEDQLSQITILNNNDTKADSVSPSSEQLS